MRLRIPSLTIAMTHVLFTINGVVGLPPQMLYTSVAVDKAPVHSFVRKCFQQKRWLRFRRSSASAPALGDANSHPVTSNGSINLSVRLGKYKCRSIFLIGNENFAVPVLICTDWLRRQVNCIACNRLQIELMDGTTLPIRPRTRFGSQESHAKEGGCAWYSICRITTEIEATNS